MTPQVKPHNFQQGWLDILKKHGFAAAVAAYLILAGPSGKQVDRLETMYAQHESEAAKTRVILVESAKRQEQLLSELVNLQRQGNEYQRTLVRQNCMLLANTPQDLKKCAQ